MAENKNGLQDIFLNGCRKDKIEVTVYLTNGVKLQGVINGFDNFVVVVRRGAQTQLVYKHSIATIIPVSPVDLFPTKDAIDNGGSLEGDAPAPFQIA
jgi:host factor-I protein